MFTTLRALLVLALIAAAAAVFSPPRGRAGILRPRPPAGRTHGE